MNKKSYQKEVKSKILQVMYQLLYDLDNSSWHKDNYKLLLKDIKVCKVRPEEKYLYKSNKEKDYILFFCKIVSLFVYKIDNANNNPFYNYHEISELIIYNFIMMNHDKYMNDIFNSWKSLRDEWFKVNSNN